MERRILTVRGVVQGVGFRPYLFRAAQRLALSGTVQNDLGTVRVDVEGPADALDALQALLRDEPPPLADVESIEVQTAKPLGAAGFRIEASVVAEGAAASEADIFLSPDVATCAACERELGDPSDRRRAYPFLNCVDCGPRLTIIEGVPYDRVRTSMRGFTMCEPCRREYETPGDRRFHAQPTACPRCGPQLVLVEPCGATAPVDDPLRDTVRRLRAGHIIALKGLGGYHLVCDATSEAAVARLRERKMRAEKAFAVMVPSLAEAEALCTLTEAERQALGSIRRPIVLARRAQGGALAASVAPNNPWVGLMLPYTPLHRLLLDAARIPLVMTSGNKSDEPIAIDNQEAHARLAHIADVFLEHDRPIVVACDDSVVRCVDEQAVPLRRARGFTPQPLSLPLSCPRPLLAVGGQMKATFALGRKRYAVLSHHLGDLDDHRSYTAYLAAIDHFARLFRHEPAVLVHDLHPDYASTAYAEARAARDGLERIAVQHHHAHIASCLADSRRSGPVIGLAFDGTGYGEDGTVWGGEVLVADYRTATRVACLRRVRMPGGSQAILQPWRMAATWLLDAGVEPSRLGLDPEALVSRVLGSGINSPLTSSAGRLFDAVAALCGVRSVVTYDGQAALELEGLASASHASGGYAFALGDADPRLLEIDPRPAIVAIVRDLERGVDRADIARRFHLGLAEAVREVCVAVKARTGIATVALSGGVFCNDLLTRTLRRALSGAGFEVLMHRRVPPNDGGLSLGQLAVAAARLSP